MLTWTSGGRWWYGHCSCTRSTSVLARCCTVLLPRPTHPRQHLCPLPWPPLQLELSVLVEQQTVTVPSNVFFGHNDEASLRTGPEVDSALGGSYTLDIELTDDSWQLNISSPMGAAGAGMDLILGLGSAQYLGTPNHMGPEPWPSRSHAFTTGQHCLG